MKFSPPDAMISALKRGIQLHKMGLSGSGLQPDTVAWAKRFISGDDASEEKIRKGNKWWGRNERFLKEPDKSPAHVAALLWGGAAGRDWFRSKYKELTHKKDEEKMGYKEEEDDF